MVAYHSALVFNVLGVAGLGENDIPLQLPDDVEQPLRDLLDTYQQLTHAQRAGEPITTPSRPWTWP